MDNERELLDVEGHKKVCRHLYEEISRVFSEHGVVSHDYCLAEKLYKKTSPQTIMISRMAKNKELMDENKKLRETLHALRHRTDFRAIEEVDDLIDEALALNKKGE